MNPFAKQITDQILSLILANPELEEDEVLRADMIEAETGMNEFVSELLRKIGSTQALRNGTLAYIKELQERKERLDRREQSLRQLIFKLLKAANQKKLERPEATVSIRNSPAKVIVTNENEIPDVFWRVKREPDKQMISAALHAHEFVPGAVLSNPEQTIAIYV